MALQVAAHGHIELLISAAQLYIRLHLHRVVALQQRIEKFVQGNRCARAVAVGEILLGQHLAHGAGAQQFNHLGQIEGRQPFAVAPHLQPPGGGEIQQGPFGILAQTQLHQVGFGIGLHFGGTELHPGGTFAGGITNAGGEITND